MENKVDTFALSSEVNELLEKYRQKDGDMSAPIRIGAICKLAGLKVYKCEMKYDGVEALLAIDNILKDEYKTNKLLRVNDKLKDYRKRFVIAKELGIFLQHRDCKTNFYHTLKAPLKKAPQAMDEMSKEERNAERFAIELLMPEERFKQAYESFAADGLDNDAIIHNIAILFAVPSFAAEMRIRSLDKNKTE